MQEKLHERDERVFGKKLRECTNSNVMRRETIRTIGLVSLVEFLRDEAGKSRETQKIRDKSLTDLEEKIVGFAYQG